MITFVSPNYQHNMWNNPLGYLQKISLIMVKLWQFAIKTRTLEYKLNAYLSSQVIKISTISIWLDFSDVNQYLSSYLPLYHTATGLRSSTLTWFRSPSVELDPQVFKYQSKFFVLLLWRHFYLNLINILITYQCLFYKTAALCFKARKHPKSLFQTLFPTLFYSIKYQTLIAFNEGSNQQLCHILSHNELQWFLF